MNKTKEQLETKICLYCLKLIFPNGKAWIHQHNDSDHCDTTLAYPSLNMGMSGLEE